MQAIMRYFGHTFNDECLPMLEDEVEINWALAYFYMKNPRNKKGIRAKCDFNAAGRCKFQTDEVQCI